MNNIPTEYKAALLSGLTGQNLKDMELAIEKNKFFAIGIDTLCGGITLGVMDNEENDATLPCLFATESEAQNEIDEELERFESEIKNDERDPDDEFEGVLHLVRWSESGEELCIYDSTGNHFLESKSATAAAEG